MKQVEPIDRLRAFVAKYGTQNDAAAALEISRPYLSDILNGRREFSDTILARLGLCRIVVEAKS